MSDSFFLVSLKLTKRDVDVSRAFLAYLSFQGDLNRAALALEMKVEDLEALAKQEDWAGKTSQFAALKEADSNLQITINRAMNFVQARQLSGLIDGVIKHLSEGDLIDALTTVTKNGTSFNVKPLTDLTKAAELVQMMSARALGDTGTKIEDDKKTGGSIGVDVLKAMDAVQSGLGLDALAIVKKSLNEPKKE